MMIGHLIKCKKCGEELQPENLLVGTSPDGKLTRKCGFCGFEEVVEDSKEPLAPIYTKKGQEQRDKLREELFEKSEKEPKTLVDLTGMVGMLPLKSDILDINVVKQEAIKRAKYYLSLLRGAELDCINYGTPFFKMDKNISNDTLNFIGRIVEIVEFNNLTEEDLK